MLAPIYFPPLHICKVCSSCLNGNIDQSTGEDVQRSIWHGGNEYVLTRTRREVELEATLGCAFCESIIHDSRYAETPEDGRNSLVAWRSIVSELENQRPPWFPSLNEKPWLRIQYCPTPRSHLTIIYESMAPARTLIEKAPFSCEWDLNTTQGESFS